MKLAIISLSTFGYFERMAAAASSMGVPTEFFDERPSNTFWTKAFLRLIPKSVARSFVRRHINAQRQAIVESGFTHALIVFAEVYSAEDIQFLQAAGVRVSRYTWDSTQNRSSVIELDRHMDAVGSFDPEDCEKFGYAYIPLYSEGVSPADVIPADQRAVDFYFCGTVHTDRAAILSAMQHVATENAWKVRWQLFFHSRPVYFLQNFGNKAAMSLFDQVSSAPFPHAETLQLSRQSKVVVDIHHAKQSGLTMRSFEALAQGAVLLTTNELALSAINPVLADRVVLLDRDNIAGSMLAAIERPSGPLADEQYYDLSLERFLEQIFSLLKLRPVNDDIEIAIEAG